MTKPQRRSYALPKAFREYNFWLDDCGNANYLTFTDLIDLFIEVGRSRLVPPEVWAVARGYFRDENLTYRPTPVWLS